MLVDGLDHLGVSGELGELSRCLAALVASASLCAALQEELCDVVVAGPLAAAGSPV